ncbi:MAG: 3'-5' exonuclease [Nitrospiraceae bacterium]
MTQLDIMIDLETLGTRPDAAIIQIGAVMFEPVSGGRIHNGLGFNKHVLYQDGIGTVDHSTICFWLQEKSAGKMGNELSTLAEFMPDVLMAFEAWPKQTMDVDWDNIGRVWANPSDFDLPILKTAHVRVGRDVPWDRRATRDARTLFDLVGGKPDIDWTGMTPHDALDDAVGQAQQVQKAMGILAGDPSV